MDKNMINIDDFVRSRLSGAEEKERPGAWSAMRDLLDKEMPVQPVAPFNWRRMLSYATALVVASSIGYGGYKMAYPDGAGRELASINAPVPNTISVNKPNNAKIVSSTTNNNSQSVDGTNTIDNSVANAVNGKNIQVIPSGKTNAASRTSASGSADHIDQHTSGSQKTTGSSDQNDGGDNNASSPLVASNASESTAKRLKDVSVANTGVPALNSTEEDHFIAGTESGSMNDAKVNPAANTDRTNTKSPIFNTEKTNNTPLKNTAKPKKVSNGGAVNNDSHVCNTGVDATDRSNKGGKQTSGRTLSPELIIPASASAVPTKPNVPTIATASQTGMANTAAVSNQPARVIDTIEQIEVHLRRVENPVTRKISYRRDTISIQKIGVPREVKMIAKNDNSNPRYLAEAEKVETARKSKKSTSTTPDQVVPHSALTSAKDVDNNANNLVSLSTYKTSSKLSNVWDANKERFSLFMHNLNVAVAKARFYAGITGGFNTTVFSTHTLAGFQLGMNGLLVLNERWSMAAEFKYNHRFNSASINDDYSRVTNIVAGNESVVNGVNYREYSWNEDKVVHQYNFTAVQTLELPVTLRYSIGRIFGEAGVNMMYGFAINAEEIERPTNSPVNYTKTFPISNSVQESIGGGKHVLLSDFDARFGLGYVLGAGYQVTPALTTNFRLVQNVWDNAATDGGRKVSRNLYQTPSIQFSVGYRFSQGRKR